MLKIPLTAVMAAVAMTSVVLAGASASASQDPLAGLSAQRISCGTGSAAITPTSASTDSLGVTHVHYKAFPKLDVAIPAAGFSAGTAPQAVLSDAHVAGKVSARAEQAMAASRQAPAFCMTSTAPPAPTAAPASGPLLAHAAAPPAPLSPSASPSPLNPSGHTWTTSWSGYVVNLSITGAQAFWNVPQSGTRARSPNADLTFVGIGGDVEDSRNHPGNYGEIAAGTSMMSNNGYQAWWSYSGTGNAIPPQNTTGYGVTFSNGGGVRPGDNMEGEVWWNNSTTPCFSMVDFVRASGNFSGCVSNPGIPYDHNSMEFIDADWPPGTMIMGFFSQASDGYLSDFGQTQWTGGDAFDPSTGRTVPFTFYTDEAYIMVPQYSGPLPPCKSGIMAYPGSVDLNNVTWNDVWCSDGPDV